MSSRWIQLLALKLLLFGVMLAFAAANRFRLTPRLKDALARGDTRRAMAALRLSLGFETAAALGVLALVGWLGTLAPPVG